MRFVDRQAWAYIARSVAGYSDSCRWACPSCESSNFRVVARKSFVTALARCQSCWLLYRAPRDPTDDSDDFYQKAYRSGTLTTTLPNGAELERMVARGFRGSDKDFSRKIRVLQALGVEKGAKVLDFGASWGYGTWQLRQAGYDASGYEISRPRAEFGRCDLGVKIVTNEEGLAGPFDVFFSSHVLEHISNPREAIAFAQRQLRPGGVFVAFTPNGSESRLERNRRTYNHSWGRLHPIYLDDVFYRNNLPRGPKLFTSRDYGRWQDIADVGAWDRKSDCISNVTKPELLVVSIH